MSAEARSKPGGFSPESSTTTKLRLRKSGEGEASRIRRALRASSGEEGAPGHLGTQRRGKAWGSSLQGRTRETRNHHGVVKACSVVSSERSVHEFGRKFEHEDSHWTPTIPIFGQLGNLRERRENDAAVGIRDYAERSCWHTSSTVPANRSPRERPDSRRNARRRKAKNASRQHGESRLGETPHGPFEAEGGIRPLRFEGTYLRRRSCVLHDTERRRRVVDTTETSPHPFGKRRSSGGRGDAVHCGRV